MPNKGVPVNLDREGRKEHIEFHKRIEVDAAQLKSAGEFAQEQGDRAKVFSDNIEAVMQDGPVQTVNGRTGQVEGLAEQEDLNDLEQGMQDSLNSVNQQLADKANEEDVITLSKTTQNNSKKLNRPLKIFESFVNELFNFSFTDGIIIDNGSDNEKGLTIDTSTSTVHSNVAIFDTLENCKSYEVTIDYTGAQSPYIRLGFGNSVRDFYFLNLPSTDGFIVSGGVLQTPSFTNENTPAIPNPINGDRIRLVRQGMNTQVYLNDVFVGTWDNTDPEKSRMFLPDIGRNYPAIAFRDGTANNRYFIKDLKVYQNTYDKMMHLSIDDCIRSLKEVTRDQPLSIFDNQFFGFYKEMHEKYGAVFSLYLFYEDWTEPSFNLSQVTGDYQKELRENSDWLRFGFHALNTEADYNALSGGASKHHYDTVINEIVRFAGYQSIDTMPRTSNFKGSLNASRAWRDADYGVTGFLSADDDRTTNLYLSADEKDSLILCDDYMDIGNNLFFMRTDLRLDIVTNPYETLESRKNNQAYRGQQDAQIIFWHEQENLTTAYKNRIDETCKWSQDNGYTFMFPMDIKPQY